jgi:two-component system chemotaxis response regulator CheB
MSTATAATYLVSIGGSAGAFESLATLLGILPREFPAAIAVAIHVGPGSAFVSALRRFSTLHVDWARPGELLQPGRVHVAPPNSHLIINPDARTTISDAPRVRHFRPSADWLFESASASFGERHTAIVLSGMMSDGAMRLHAVKGHGGRIVVQDPLSCRYGDMPRAAIATGHVDRVLTLLEMRDDLVDLMHARDTQLDAARWENPFAA